MTRSDPADLPRLPLVVPMALIVVVLAASVAPAQETATPPATATTPTTAPAPAPLPSPKAIAIAFAAAVDRGDVAAARALVTPDPADARWATATVELGAALKKLDAAATARFGEGTPSVSQSQLHLSESIKSLEQAQEKVEGDEATVTVAAGRAQPPLRFRKVEGKWSLVPPLPEASLEQTVGLYNRLVKAADRTAKEIASGVYKTAADARAAFDSRVIEARLAR
jgi:hypothetical protein